MYKIMYIPNETLGHLLSWRDLILDAYTHDSDLNRSVTLKAVIDSVWNSSTDRGYRVRNSAHKTPIRN